MTEQRINIGFCDGEYAAQALFKLLTGQNLPYVQVKNYNLIAKSCNITASIDIHLCICENKQKCGIPVSWGSQIFRVDGNKDNTVAYIYKCIDKQVNLYYNKKDASIIEKIKQECINGKIETFYRPHDMTELCVFFMTQTRLKGNAVAFHPDYDEDKFDRATFQYFQHNKLKTYDPTMYNAKDGKITLLRICRIFYMYEPPRALLVYHALFNTINSVMDINGNELIPTRVFDCRQIDVLTNKKLRSKAIAVFQSMYGTSYSKSLDIMFSNVALGASLFAQCRKTYKIEYRQIIPTTVTVNV